MVDVSLRLLEKASATGALQDAACALAADVTLTILLSDIPYLPFIFRLSRGINAHRQRDVLPIRQLDGYSFDRSSVSHSFRKRLCLKT